MPKGYRSPRALFLTAERAETGCVTHAARMVSLRGACPLKKLGNLFAPAGVKPGGAFLKLEEAAFCAASILVFPEFTVEERTYGRIESAG